MARTILLPTQLESRARVIRARRDPRCGVYVRVLSCACTAQWWIQPACGTIRTTVWLCYDLICNKKHRENERPKKQQFTYIFAYFKQRYSSAGNLISTHEERKKHGEYPEHELGWITSFITHQRAMRCDTWQQNPASTGQIKNTSN